MATTIKPVDLGGRVVVERLWQLYSHDLSEFRGSRPDAEGRFKRGRLPSYYDDPDSAGHLIMHDDGLAGFAFIRGLITKPAMMAEFFVIRALRGLAVASTAALTLIAAHPGAFEIAFQEENPRAARFWRRIATQAAGVDWIEERRPVPGKPHIPPDTWLTLFPGRPPAGS